MADEVSQSTVLSQSIKHLNCIMQAIIRALGSCVHTLFCVHMYEQLVWSAYVAAAHWGYLNSW